MSTPLPVIAADPPVTVRTGLAEPPNSKVDVTSMLSEAFTANRHDEPAAVMDSVVIGSTDDGSDTVRVWPLLIASAPLSDAPFKRSALLAVAEENWLQPLLRLI